MAFCGLFFKIIPVDVNLQEPNSKEASVLQRVLRDN